MAIIKFKDKNGNWKILTIKTSLGDNAEEIYIGNEKPSDLFCKVWYNTSTPVPVANCQVSPGQWVEVAGGGGSEIDYITDEEYEEIMGGLGI